MPKQTRLQCAIPDARCIKHLQPVRIDYTVRLHCSGNHKYTRLHYSYCMLVAT